MLNYSTKMFGYSTFFWGEKRYNTWIQSVVSSKWIYKIKHTIDGNIKKYKTMLVISLRKRESIMTRRAYRETSKTWDSLQRITCAHKDLHMLRRNPWGNTYNDLSITQSDGYLHLCYKVEYGNLHRTRSSQIGVRETFKKVEDGRSGYPVILRDDIDGYTRDQQQRRLLVT